MKWLELKIDTCHEGLSEVETLLSSLGIDGIIVDDETEFRDFLQETRPHWDYVDEDLLREKRGKSRVTFYLESGEEGFAKLGEVRLALSWLKERCPGCGPLLLSMEDVEAADWENGWKQYYKPIEIGSRLLVIPAWESVPHGDRVPLRLDPGLAFGTGSHATTRLCLAALDQRIRGGETVLDLGCGSGILSIAALLLGAKSAFACDIDDKAVAVTRENAALNGIAGDFLTVRTGDILTDAALRTSIGTGYDLVLANIVADVIIALAPAVRPLLREGGLFLCSGIIDERAEEVADKLTAAGLTLLDTRRSEGWVSYLCR